MPDHRIPEAIGQAGRILPAGGEMKRLTYEKDWSATPLGPLSDWPQSLKSAVEIMLHSSYPMLVWWGPRLIQLYNDAYTPVLGLRHPSGLGQPAAECWAEAWPTVGPLADAVMTKGVSTWSERLQIVMTRNGWPEEVYMTFSYSPITDRDGAIGGLFCACTEETQRVLAERRLSCLRALGEGSGQAASVEQACAMALQVLDRDRHDLPFALVYVNDAEGHTANLSGARETGLNGSVCPRSIDLRNGSSCWRLGEVNRTGSALELDLSAAGIDPIPSRVWPERVTRALVLPMARPGQDRLAGFAIAGISPRLNLDEGYRAFLELAARQVAASIASAQAYQEERRRAEALAEIDRVKTQFFSNVSHEFRTPLTLMLGPLEQVLSRAALAEADREPLTVAHRNALRLLKLVNTLLDFSRVEAGRARAKFEPTDLAAYTAELASNFRSACERAGLDLTIDCQPTPVRARVDREMWEKVVLNLLSNAFKFTFQGGISVGLRALGSQVEFSVPDTGTGIPVDELPHIFERFHRVEAARGRTHEGTGIGLALVQELVKLHNGTISVESTPGQGSTFRVRIPSGNGVHRPDAEGEGSVREPASTAVHAEAFLTEALRWLPDGMENKKGVSLAEPERPESAEPGPGPERILVVDDNADMRDYVRRLLGGHYAVVTASNGEEGLQVALREPPDLTLADIMMPGMDGFGLLEALRSHPATAERPVILLSARAGEEARSEGMEAGADDYLVKPFSSRELLARVRAHLGLARARKRASQALQEREAWLAGQREALETALDGAPLERSLGVLVRTTIELLGPETRAAFYAADAEGATLHHLVGMDAAYAAAVDGFQIGPESLACGLATHTGRPVITEDVTKEPLWAPWLWLAEKAGYRGCWSFPIHTSAGKFVGTFAIYSRQPRRAAGQEVEFAQLITQTAAMIIARHADAEVRRRAEDALRESEQNLRAVANIVPDLLWYSGPDGKTQWYNDRWMEYTGQAFDGAAARDWTHVLHPDDRDVSARRYQEAVEQGALLQLENRIRRHDGEYRWFLVRAEPFHDEQGRMIRMYGAATDIHEQRTARVRLEEEVANRTAELEVRVAERDALLQEVHHRVKNNLHVVNSMLEMQARRTEDYSAFQQLQEACNRVMSIAEIHELLYQSGSLSAVDLTAYAGRLVGRLVDLYRVHDRIRATVEGESVAVDLDQAVPCGLVLNELVSNAFKHGFPEGLTGKLTISLSREEAQVRLKVQDTGIGLPEFDFRNSPSLGLKIVNLLADQLRGAVTFRNGCGACVELRFPVSRPV
jgi:PAS domain S-box-containing protein